METSDSFSFLRLLKLLLVWGIVIALMVRAYWKSEDRPDLLLRWALTLATLFFIWKVVLPVIAGGDHAAAFVGVPLTAISGVILAGIWRNALAGFVAAPFAWIYDGGKEEIEARPLYSRAEALKQKGQFTEAIAEARAQLDKFPGDFAGQLLIAEINAEDLKDLQSAEIAVQRIVNQPGHTPGQIAAALHALADWHMKLAQDPDSAALALDQIIQRFPDSSFAQMAAERKAHLTSVETMLESRDRHAIPLKHVEYSTLANPVAQEKAVLDPRTEAIQLQEHLHAHPFDIDARERLALVYANQLNRLDLATGELEAMIESPNQTPKRVAHWLNLMADLQMRIENDVAAAKQTLRRLQERLAGTHYAEQAALRMEYLGLESRRHDVPEMIKMGIYEKDLGLKKPVS